MASFRPPSRVPIWSEIGPHLGLVWGESHLGSTEPTEKIIRQQRGRDSSPYLGRTISMTWVLICYASKSRTPRTPLQCWSRVRPPRIWGGPPPFGTSIIYHKRGLNRAKKSRFCEISAVLGPFLTRFSPIWSQIRYQSRFEGFQGQMRQP